MGTFRRVVPGFLVLFLATATVAEGRQTGLPDPPADGDSRGVVLIFPPVIDFVHDGQFDIVPDDQTFRTYLVSVARGLNEYCFARSNVSSEAMTYGFPIYRRMMQDPVGAAMEQLQRAVGAIDQMHRGGNMMDAIQNMSDGVSFSAWGVEDGYTLARTYSCNSLTIRQVRTRLEQLFQERQFRTPEALDEERRTRLMHPDVRPLVLGQAGGPPTSPTAQAERQRVQDAEARRHAEEEQRAYEQAQGSRSLGAVNAYLTRYPSGRWVHEITQIRDALDEDGFQEARSRNRAASYEQYLRDFPNGRHAQQARSAIAALDEEAFRSASVQNTTMAYEAYLREFPRGQYRAQADAALQAIERRAFDEARQRNTVAAFETYLSRYPQGRYAAQVRNLVSLTGQVEAREVEIRAQRSALNSAQGRANFYGGASLAGLGGAGVAGFLAYREYDTGRTLERRIKEMERNSEERRQAEADLDDAKQKLMVFGVAAVAGLVVTQRASQRRGQASREAARARTALGQLEQRQAQDRQRISELLSAQLSVVPRLDRHLQPGIALRLRL